MRESTRKASAGEIIIPSFLKTVCSDNAERAKWLERLPDTITELQGRWKIDIGDPIMSGATCSWVAPCRRGDSFHAILKVGMPHMEGEGEIDGLIHWNGHPTVQLLDADRESNALLLERCMPGDPLKLFPQEEQDVIVAEILRTLWEKTPEPEIFRPLSEMIAFWNTECTDRIREFSDPGLAREGMRIKEELAAPAAEDRLLATDLHAGNVLRAERRPWLAIDPKPFLGDRTYDGTQHLVNSIDRLEQEPRKTIESFAELIEVDADRLQLWLFARLATEFRGRYQKQAKSIRSS